MSETTVADANVDVTDADATEKPAKETKRAEQTNPLDKAPSEAHISCAKYVTANSDVEISPEQAQALLILHAQWQASPERKAEREQVKAEKAVAKAKADEEREAAKKEREAKAAQKKADDEAKAAAKAAAESDDDSDLADEPNDDTTEAKPVARRRRPKSTTEAKPE